MIDEEIRKAKANKDIVALIELEKEQNIPAGTALAATENMLEDRNLLAAIDLREEDENWNKRMKANLILALGKIEYNLST